MKKISAALLTLILVSSPCLAEEEKTFAGFLPQGVSSILDNLTSGGVGKVYIDKICYGRDEKQSLTMVKSQINSSINQNLADKYRPVAKKYTDNAISDKMKAFKLAYSQKTCEEMDNIKTIASTYGFL